MTRTLELTALPLTSSNFAPFGEVIEAGLGVTGEMNQSTFERYSNLGQISVSDPAHAPTARIGMVRSARPTPLPYQFTLIERHPLCSQAFIPRGEFSFPVVVGPREIPANKIKAEDLCAFVCRAGQGVNYHAGTWHMPLISTESGQEFLVIDQADRPGNLEERQLSQSVKLLAMM